MKSRARSWWRPRTAENRINGRVTTTVEKTEVTLEQLQNDIRLNVVDIADFNERVVGSYNAGTAEKGLEADGQGECECETNDRLPHDDTFEAVHLTAISGAVVGRVPPAPFCRLL